MSRHAGLRNLKSLAVLTPSTVVVAIAILGATAGPMNAQDAIYTPEFTSDKMLKIPNVKVWREWPFVGGLVTPNALNDGNAPFPEHHIIYIDPVSWVH
jgi:hypothetical protein